MMVKCKLRGSFDLSNISPLEVDVVDTRHAHDSEENDHAWRTHLVHNTVDMGGANRDLLPNQVPRLVDFAIELIRYCGLPTPSLQAISVFKEKVNGMDTPEKILEFDLSSKAKHRVVEESGETGEPQGPGEEKPSNVDADPSATVPEEPCARASADQPTHQRRWHKPEGPKRSSPPPGPLAVEVPPLKAAKTNPEHYMPDAAASQVAVGAAVEM